MKTENFDIAKLTRDEKIRLCLKDVQTENCLTGNAIMQIAFSFDEIADDDLDGIEKHFLAVCEQYDLEKRPLANALFMYFVGKDQHDKSAVMQFIQD